MLKNKVLADLTQVIKELDLPLVLVEPSLDHPTEGNHGDYAANLALVLWGKRKKDDWDKQNLKTPFDLARKIIDCYKIKKSASYFEKIEIAPPGFINFWLSDDYLLKELAKIITEKDGYGKRKEDRPKRLMVEFAHPNPLKTFHIGHLRNIFLGEAIVRLEEAVGERVVRANYEGDVGLHIAKAIYALLHVFPFKEEILKIKGIYQRVEFLGKAYAAGNSAFEESEEAKSVIKDINFLVYASAEKFQEEKGAKSSSTDYRKFVQGRVGEVEKVFELWRKTRQWSLDYFEEIYKRVYTYFDRYYFESECSGGLDLAKEAVKKGVLEESDGAIIFNGKKYGLDTRVFVNSLGLPTYEAKELALAEKEFGEFGDLDRVIHVVGPEQSSFFKVTFKVEELLNPDKYKDKQYHLMYGWVRLKRGKMSSRTGNVVPGEWLLNEVRGKLKRRYQMGEETSETVAIGAVKYSFLKIALLGEIAFDIEESISLAGNSGPYLQYTFARTQSVLSKVKSQKSKVKIDDKFAINPEEQSILRTLYKFPEVVEEAAINYAPNLLCTFLFDLAQKFNLFYQKHPIIKADESQRDLRLGLTQAVGQVVKNGLWLLGILAPEKM